MVIATKFTPSPWRTTVQSVLDACDASRRRLGVESIDLYQLHMPDLFSSNNPIYWQGLAECYHRGWVKNVGVCNYGPTLVAQCQEALGDVPLASNQIAYSLLGRHNGAQATVDYCRRNGIAVLAFFPLAMGVLTGKYNDDTTSKSTSSQKSPWERQDLRMYSRDMGALLRVVRRIAQDRQRTVSQVALAYVVSQGAIPIPGARTEAQVRDNLAAAEFTLTASEIEALETAADAVAGFEGAGLKRANEKFVGYGMEAWALD